MYNEFSEDRLAKFQLDVVLPNGGVAHLPDSALVNIGAGQELEITGIRQVVPGKAPHGEYTYRIFVSSENGGYRVLESIPFYKSQDKSMESAGGSWATLGLSAEISPEGSNWGEDRSQPFHGVSPNPLNSAGTIWFELSRQSNLKLQVFDVSGRLVRTLIAGENREAGVHRVSWNGRDDKGRPVATGIYFYRLESGGMSQTGRMVFVK